MAGHLCLRFLSCWLCRLIYIWSRRRHVPVHRGYQEVLCEPEAVLKLLRACTVEAA